MKRFSLRWLLLGSVLGAIVVGFTGFAIYLDRVEVGNRLEDIDAELVRAERAGVPRPSPAPGGAGPERAADEAEVGSPPLQMLLALDGTIIATGETVNPFDTLTLAELALGSGIVTTRDPRYRVLRTTTPDGLVAVTALPLDDLDAAAKRFRAALALGGGVILTVAAIVLWAITGLLIRPVTRLANAASSIADGDLDTPIGQPSGTRETVDLALDLDRMVARLREALAESNRSREATERLLADLAHEIRTPLTALKGYSDLYAQGMLEDKAHVDRAMARIGNESERMSALANAMLQLARDGSTTLQRTEFDLASLLDEVAADLCAAYPEQAIEVDAARPLMVQGSRERLQQAILNLGSNACHHNPTGGTVLISSQALPEGIRVSVADDGPGVAANDRDHIFQPFYRSDAARSREGAHNVGLGLALTQQIAEQHNATLSLESPPGGGATFVMVIPSRTAS